MEVVDTPDIILESEKKISDDGATPVRDVKAEPSVEATVHDFVEDIKHVKRELRPRLKKSDWPMNAASCSVKMEPPDLDRFLREAKLFEPDILWSTLGAIVFPQVSLWDILVQKMKSADNFENSSPVDAIKLMISELDYLLDEVKLLLSNCCTVAEDDFALSSLNNLKLSEALSLGLFGNTGYHVESKDYGEMPPFYLQAIFTNRIKLEDPINGTFLQYVVTDDDVKVPIVKKPPKKKNRVKTKRQIEASIQRQKKKRPKLKDVPAELKVLDDDQVFKSQRRSKCDTCTRTFCSKQNLEAHQKGKCPGKPDPKWHYTNGSSKRLYCIHPDCLGRNGQFDINTHSSVFTSQNINIAYFKHVMENHASLENCHHKCDSCTQSFPNKDTFKFHKKTCGDNFTCKYCGQGVPNKRTLYLHETSHLAQKPFKCPHCDYNSVRKACVEIHVRGVHQNDRPEMCQLCGKAFKVKKQLTEHIKTHSDVKRYSCEICGAKLKNDTCYRSHMMNVHGQKIPCDICGKFYFRQEGLKRHKRQEHGVDVFDN